LKPAGLYRRMAYPMKNIGPRILPILAIALLSCASGHHEPFVEDPPISRDLDAFAARLQSLCDGSPLLELERAGEVEYHGFSTPIWVVRYRPSGAERRVLITGGVHGNEPAGCAWVGQLVERIAERPRLYADSDLDLVPLVNPWGWSHDVRYNRDGKDINRDFASFETQEARILESLFAPREYDLVIDHHEDPDAGGFYLYQYAKRDTTLSRQVIREIRSLGYPIEQDVRMVILRTRDGLIDAPRWGLRYMRLTGQLSITNYLRLEGCQEVYTIETPTHLPMEDRLRMHRTAFELIFSGLIE
jgi:protein MpaA